MLSAGLSLSESDLSARDWAVESPSGIREASEALCVGSGCRGDAYDADADARPPEIGHMIDNSQLDRSQLPRASMWSSSNSPNARRLLLPPCTSWRAVRILIAASAIVFFAFLLSEARDPNTQHPTSKCRHGRSHIPQIGGNCEARPPG